MIWIRFLLFGHFRSNLFLSFEDKEKMKKVEQISLIKIDFSLFFVLSFETDDRSRFYMEWKKEENSISVIIIVIIMTYVYDFQNFHCFQRKYITARASGLFIFRINTVCIFLN